MKIYKVGGAIRDGLLNRPVKDCDWVVVGATVNTMLELGYQAVGKDFPVFLHPQTHEEYALARTEKKVSAGYTGFTVDATEHVTLEEDLKRRDLTINAMAESTDGDLIDPHNGRADLEAGVLRHVSPAFIEDPVRILRVARFAARYDFQIAPETLTLMQEMVAAGEVDALVPERVWAELESALSELYVYRFIEVLRVCGALKILFPEIDVLFGIPQPVDYHPEVDTGEHTLLTVQMAVKLSDEPCVRFAALVHDLGKGITPRQALPSHKGHEERGVPLIKALCLRLRIPNRYRKLAVAVSRFHLHVHKAFELKPKTVLKVIEGVDGFRQADVFEQFLLTCEADARGRGGMQGSAYPQADYFRQCYQAATEVRANNVQQGLKGKAIGVAMHEARVSAIAAIKSATEIRL